MDANEGQLVVASQQTIFAGPLPSPEDLAQYKQIDSSYAERIFLMAEEHNKADVHNKYADISIKKSIAHTTIAGQVFSFLLGISGIGAAVFLSLKGYTPEAIVSIIAGFSPIIISAITKIAPSK
ncbi:MAG: DUF2335 domain-containing protein [Spirochaetaceae bacterium]|jgi:uncharacterized membrane protein|nr:DUF2335 domain-containing protein [Spirochaetaceae bacterium]